MQKQKDKKQRQKKRKKQEQRGKTKAKKSKDAFIARFDDDSSYAGKFVYSHFHTPFSLLLSLYLVFPFFLYIIYWYIYYYLYIHHPSIISISYGFFIISSSNFKLSIISIFVITTDLG